ncbi:GNAT family N-acetyltransferase [Photobacterium rosenbergii]|nr:GNAT family N-acetyltransferase [Photobacterium rosenbergii]
MLRQLQLTDKAKMLELVNKTQIFAPEEVSFIADTFEGESSEAVWFGKFEGERMIGVAYCVPMEMTNATWNVLMLLVDPEHHRRGIGKELMQLMESTLTQKGQRLLIVETSSTDDFRTARSFYRAIGYAQQGAIEHYYDDDDHKITFIKRL